MYLSLAIQAIQLLLGLDKIRRMIYTELHVLGCDTSYHRFAVFNLFIVNALRFKVYSFVKGFLAGHPCSIT